MFPQVSDEEAAREKRDPHHASTEKSIQSFRHQITHRKISVFFQLCALGHSEHPSTLPLHHTLQDTAFNYLFSLRCHPTGLYQIFADGVSMPNHTSQLLRYLGPKGHPATHIHASKVRDKQKVLLCSCLPARVS